MYKKVIYSVFIPSLLMLAETAVESSAQHVTLPDGQSYSTNQYYHYHILYTTHTDTLFPPQLALLVLNKKNQDFSSQITLLHFTDEISYVVMGELYNLLGKI